MCGIMITKKGFYNGSMKHRGIRTHVREADPHFLELVHEHLPIQALGSDPIIETDRWTVLFNGELFIGGDDIQWLRELFEGTRNIKEAVQEISKQDGFWGLIIVDKIFREITAFTDPLGKKQLYWSLDGISSEIHPHSKGEKDIAFFGEVQKFGYNTNNRTPWMNVKRLMPNTVYTFDYNFNITAIEEDYYKFKPTSYDNLYDTIDLACKNRLAGHATIGMLLSGGLDSSIIRHHISKTDAKVQSYCVNNEEDVKYAQIMDPNVELIELEYNDEALKVMEMPIDLGSMYAQYSLFEKVNETVVLTGDGADEAFGGYRRMKEYDSQMSDVFNELPFYHNVRVDRMSMWFTKEARSPFMSIPVIEAAMSIPYEFRVDKSFLRVTYDGILPDEIMNRPKEPLKSGKVRNTEPFEYRRKLIETFLKNQGA